MQQPESFKLIQQMPHNIYFPISQKMGTQHELTMQ